MSTRRSEINIQDSARGPSGQVGEQLVGRLVEPVGVVDHEDGRCPHMIGVEQIAHRCPDPLGPVGFLDAIDFRGGSDLGVEGNGQQRQPGREVWRVL